MAKKSSKVTHKKKTKTLATSESREMTENGVSSGVSLSQGESSKKMTAIWLVSLVFLVVGVYAVKNKSMFVVALVNNAPVFRWDLNSVMVSRFGKQTLESMISEKLIAGEAAKAGAIVGQKDIDEKEQEILKSFGSKVNVDDFLRIQGVTKEEFDRQIKLQLLVQKTLGKNITISDDDVNNFIATNRAVLVATDEAGLKTEAKQAIFDQMVGEKFQSWFTTLKDKAKVLRFL
ncbi:hypothetical protein HY947_03985 [Candidatus Gottesmanbacteria bacterium]|nr:hypothetical protein [Candidatus Gottesmanbacteria bacterium]